MEPSDNQPKPTRAGRTAKPTSARRALRQRQFKAGLICFNDRHSTLPCTVRDLSDTGARLLAPSLVGIPCTFELYIEIDGTWVDCKIVWQQTDALGVAFTSAPVRVAARRKQVVRSFTEPVRPVTLRKTTR